MGQESLRPIEQAQSQELGQPSLSSIEILQKHLALPSHPIMPGTMATAQSTAGVIARKVKEQGNVLCVDLEWSRNTKEGPGTIGIGLKDGSVYLFHVPMIGGIPKGIKTLMQEPTIQKVGNRFHNDVKKFREAGIEVREWVELGKMAKARGIFNRADSGLADQVLKLLDCELPKEDSIRCSRWNDKVPLTKKQIEYAALDVYATRSVYLTLVSMPWIDPCTTPSPAREELKNGTDVLVYSRNLSQLVAHGKVASETPNNAFDQLREKKMVVIRILRDDVIVPITEPFNKNHGTTLDEIFNVNNSSVPVEHVDTPWEWQCLRLMPERVENGQLSIRTRSNDDEPKHVNVPGFKVHTKMVAVTVEAGGAFASTPAGGLGNGWCVEGEQVKNDAVHIFFRFKRVLSVNHGCFRPFMARLSDAIFVPSHSDIEFIKEVLKKHGYSVEDIEKMGWNFYKRSVRRAIPAAVILDANLEKVFELFADEVDQKTGKKFFSKEAHKVAKSVRDHVKKGCLSDVPGMMYYVQIGEDEWGIPKYKCFRGTSGLEGFHQKIRQLIRGFSVSPRLVIALLYEYIHRWNHDIDCRILRFLSELEHFYDGFTVEEEMEFMRDWDLEKRPHGDWISTLDFGSTGEEFGLVGQSHRMGDDEELDKQVQAMMDAVESGLFLQSDEELEDEKESFASIPESSAWISRKLRTSRPVRGVETPTEKKFYEENHLQFQSSSQQQVEADNYTSIQFGAFCMMWNGIIAEEEDGKRPKTDMTLKSAYHLMEYHKTLKRESNASLTMLGIADANKNLRRELRGSKRSADTAFPEALPASKVFDTGPTNNELTCPLTGDGDDDDCALLGEDDDAADQAGPVLGRQGTERVYIPFAPVVDGAVATAYNAVQPHLQAKEGKSKRAPPRCRKCGHERTDPRWKKQHQEKEGFKVGKDSRERPCSVPVADRLEGFPIPEGERMPDRR